MMIQNLVFYMSFHPYTFKKKSPRSKVTWPGWIRQKGYFSYKVELLKKKKGLCKLNQYQSHFTKASPQTLFLFKLLSERQFAENSAKLLEWGCFMSLLKGKAKTKKNTEEKQQAQNNKKQKYLKNSVVWCLDFFLLSTFASNKSSKLCILD